LLNAGGSSPLILVCDHASNRVPRSLQNLGLPPEVLATHIGWDPGAAEVARGLSQQLDAPLLLSNYSRLVIDCNRPPASPQSIPQYSDGVMIPGNHNLSESHCALRRESLFQPYQQAVAQLLQQRLQQPRQEHISLTALLSIHSFTPNLNGEQRPWQMGVAWFRDDRLAQSLYSALQQSERVRASDWQVGFNQPYAIDTEYDYTVPVQGESRGIPSAMVEMRQDVIANVVGVQQLVDLLASAWSAAWPLAAS